MPEAARARVRRRPRISPVWLVPLAALVVGVWMVWVAWMGRGPEITISFETAEGLEAGRTPVKVRSVEVGVVEEISLAADLSHVVVRARLEPEAEPLLREDTVFFVVRPRIGVGGVTGIETLLSGGYIELAPGRGPGGRRRFEGLDEPPQTPVGTPGLRVVIASDRAVSLLPGAPVLYKGFAVGRVETASLDLESKRMHYRCFIDAPYDRLVTDRTRFYSRSGFSFSATAEGIRVSTGTLESLVVGGVAFELPTGVEPGEPARDGAVFELFPSRESIDEQPYRRAVEYVVRFRRSVRGLHPGAPVEYRGIRAGRVERLLLEGLLDPERVGAGEAGDSIPVLIRIEPGRLALGDSEEGERALRAAVRAAVARGLRASLVPGNLLTGSLLVSLDFFPKEPPARLGEFAGRELLPSVDTGIEGLGRKVDALLDKLLGLEVERTLASTDAAIRRLEDTLGELEALVGDPSLRRVPAAATEALREAERSLGRLSDLIDTLEEQPSRLLFRRRPEPDPEVPAGAGP